MTPIGFPHAHQLCVTLRRMRTPLATHSNFSPNWMSRPPAPPERRRLSNSGLRLRHTDEVLPGAFGTARRVRVDRRTDQPLVHDGRVGGDASGRNDDRCDGAARNPRDSEAPSGLSPPALAPGARWGARAAPIRGVHRQHRAARRRRVVGVLGRPLHVLSSALLEPASRGWLTAE